MQIGIHLKRLEKIVLKSLWIIISLMSERYEEKPNEMIGSLEMKRWEANWKDGVKWRDSWRQLSINKSETKSESQVEIEFFLIDELNSLWIRNRLRDAKWHIGRNCWLAAVIRSDTDSESESVCLSFHDSSPFRNAFLFIVFRRF